MDKWVVRGKELPVWKALETLGPVLDQAEAQAKTSTSDPADFFAINRVRVLHASMGKRISGVDPYFLLPGPLNLVADAVTNAKAHVQAYLSSRSASDLEHANNYVDQALTSLAGIAPPGSTEEFLPTKEEVERLRGFASQAMAELVQMFRTGKDEAAAFEEKLAALHQEVETKKAELDALASSQTDQFDASQENRRKLFANDQANRNAASDTEGAEYRAKRNEELKALAALRDEAEKQRDDLLKSLNDQFVEKAEKLHSAMDNRRVEIETLVGVIGTLGVTAGHKKAAKEAKDAARWWQGLTVGSLSLLALFAVGSYFNFFGWFSSSIPPDFSWPSVAGRALVTVTFGLLAAYAGRQGAREQKRAMADEELALKLAALEPFLAPLPEDKQNEVRMEMANLSLVRPAPDSQENERDGAVGVPSVVSDLMKLAGGKGIEVVVRRGS